jgi:hypothetical protein
VRGSPLELRRQSSDKQGVFFFFLRKTEKGKSQNTRETSLLVKRTDGLQSASRPFPSIAGFFLNGICSYLSVCFVYLITYSVKSLVDYINTLTRNVSGFINDLVGSIYFLHVMFYYSIGLCEMIEEFTL